MQTFWERLRAERGAKTIYTTVSDIGRDAVVNLLGEVARDKTEFRLYALTCFSVCNEKCVVYGFVFVFDTVLYETSRLRVVWEIYCTCL